MRPEDVAKLSVARTSDFSSMSIHETAKDAGCFTFLGESWVIDDTIDPHLIQEIHTFDPNFVPLLVRRRYRTPANTDIMVPYHCIGRYIENPQEGFEDQAIKLEFVPRGFPFPPDKIHPLRTLMAHWDKDDHPAEFDMAAPPARLEFGPWVVEQMRALHKALNTSALAIDSDGHVHHTESTRDKIREILEAESKRDEEECRKGFEEARYRMRHNWRWFKEAADKEQWTEPPSSTSKKVTVDYGDVKSDPNITVTAKA